MSVRRMVLDRMPPGWRTALRNLKADLRLLRSMLGDWLQFRRQSGLLSHRRPEVLKTQLFKAYHKLEKGLALPAPRPGFGAEAVADLVGQLERYLALCGPDDVSRAALNTLQHYLRFNASHGRPMPDLEAQVSAMLQRQADHASHGQGGVVAVQRAQIMATAGIDFEAFALSRHSVRQFAPGPVPQAAIDSAVRCALKAPSVCNRQSGLVYVVRDAATRQRMLAFQNGNRGFGDQAEVVLLVASRLAAFHTPGERFQSWIDGGLFAMSLLHGLHAQGLGACCLNWSVTREHDARFKRSLALPDDIEVIMMIAVGQLPEAMVVAESPRRPISDVCFPWPATAARTDA